MQDKCSKYAFCNSCHISNSKSLHTKSSLTYISMSIQNFMWFINSHCKIKNKKKCDFVQWAYFWITQEVTLLKFNIFQCSTATTCSVLIMHSHHAGTTHGTKSYSSKVNGVLQWHNAHDLSYCDVRVGVVEHN